MNNQKISLVFLIVFSIIIVLNSCVTIFGTGKTKVTVTSETPDATISVNNKIIGKGVASEKILNRSDIANIKVSKEGYISKNHAIGSYKVNKLILLNIAFIPAFGVGLGGLYYDYLAAKRHLYDKNINVPSLVPEPLTRSEEQKYLKINKTSLIILSGDTIVNKYNSMKKYEKHQKFSSTASGEKIKYDETIFTKTLNNFLGKYDYVDTSGRFFPNYTNTNYINANITSVNFDYIRLKTSTIYSNIYLIKANTKITWVILDYFRVPQDSIIIQSESDLFSSLDESDEEASLNNAIEYNLIKLLADERFKNILNSKSENKNIEPFIYKSIPYVSKNLNQLVKGAVTIQTDKKSHGSGFFISPDGYIITNYHVVANNDNVKVITNTGVKYDGKVIRTSPIYDVALIKVDAYQAEHMNFSNIEIDNIQLGTDASTIGTPNSIELGQSVAKGIISGVRPVNNLHYIQTTIPINAGNSGGALLDSNGKVIGVVTAKLIGVGIEGIAFAVPTKYIFEGLNIKN